MVQTSQKSLTNKISNCYKSQVLWWAKHPKLLVITKFLTLFLFFLYFTYTRLDPDFGWHLQAGNYIRSHGIPYNDVFAYPSEAFRWVNHEWLNAVFMSGIYSIGGYFLISIFYAFLWALAFIITAPKNRIAILLIGAMTILPYAMNRPTAWTVLGLAILIKLLNSKMKWLLAVIPLLFLLWVNLHGGFFVGFMVIAFLAVKRKSLWLVLVLATSIAISLVNPYGVHLYQELFRIMFDRSMHTNISEWHYFNLGKLSWAYIVLWGTGFWIFSRNKLSNWLDLGPIFFAASLSATRHLPLFVIVSLSSLDTYYTKAKMLLPKKLNKKQKVVIAIFYLAIAGWYIYIMAISFDFTGQKSFDSSYPKKTVAYLQNHRCQGNLFNNYDIGGYLIWKLPSHKVYIDGRGPVWYDSSGKTYLSRYIDIKAGKNWQQEFKKYNITCALIPENFKLTKELKDNNWQILMSEGRFILLKKP